MEDTQPSSQELTVLVKKVGNEEEKEEDEEEEEEGEEEKEEQQEKEEEVNGKVVINKAKDADIVALENIWQEVGNHREAFKKNLKEGQGKEMSTFIKLVASYSIGMNKNQMLLIPYVYAFLDGYAFLFDQQNQGQDKHLDWFTVFEFIKKQVGNEIQRYCNAIFTEDYQKTEKKKMESHVIQVLKQAEGYIYNKVLDEKLYNQCHILDAAKLTEEGADAWNTMNDSEKKWIDDLGCLSKLSIELTYERRNFNLRKRDENYKYGYYSLVCMVTIQFYIRYPHVSSKSESRRRSLQLLTPVSETNTTTDGISTSKRNFIINDVPESAVKRLKSGAGAATPTNDSDEEFDDYHARGAGAAQKGTTFTPI